MSVLHVTLLGFAVVGVLVGAGAQLLRWLRVLQREHYAPSSVPRFVGRWCNVRGVRLDPVVVVFAGIAVALRWWLPASLFLTLYGVVLPRGLSIRGRTAPLAWTRRLKTVTATATVLGVVVCGALLLSPYPAAAALVVCGVPYLLDIAARLVLPYEDRAANGFVATASERLRKISPVVVGITGSYGKTSTKQHLAELLRSQPGVVPTPRSFNNRAGLSRAINENLVDGTEIFIAEMGTYGPGEIAELVRWCPPKIAVITAVGPVHLERMKSLDVIEAAKFEITTPASVVVLNVDDERLAGWVPRLRAAGKTVRTAGSRRADVDVRVHQELGQWHVTCGGTLLVTMPAPSGLQPTNVACAIAAAQELGVGDDELVARLRELGPVSNRLVVMTAPSGVVVIDDTFNANPASARSALSALRELSVTGRRVVVTPGLIELGSEQERENQRLGALIQENGCELAIVGRTNAQSLELGFGVGARRFAVRDDAVAWVRTELRPHDAVLYLNDLPDHYP